jgi:ribose 5-phosphate isomerase A
MTIIERALELVEGNTVLGLGSGRAAQAFVRALGEKIRAGRLQVRGVPTSNETAELAHEVGVPLVPFPELGFVNDTFDGADEVDPNLDMIKGYGRALVREKIIAAASQRRIILVGEEKLVPQLGSRGKLPVEVVPLALYPCKLRLSQLGLEPIPYMQSGTLFVTDNGNNIIDCQTHPIDDPESLESQIRAIPGVVGTGLFLGMADFVLVGDRNDFRLLEERRRKDSTYGD